MAPSVEPTTQQNDWARHAVDAAFAVHQALGPGLLETVYERCLAHELRLRGLCFVRQKAVPLIYRGQQIGAAFRADLIIEEAVVLEIKSCETLLPVHRAQSLTYLKLAGYPLGLLINFNVPRIKDGIRRVILSNV